MSKVLVVRNEAQKILFEEELAGQISDGFWENASPMDHWKPWSECTVVVGKIVGRNFYPRKANYNFASKDLLECVGERMLESVKATQPDYTEKDLRRDLKDLKTIVRTYNS